MSINKGVCTNLPTECDKSRDKEQQQMPTDDTRCSECDSLLRKEESNSNPNLPKLIIMMLLGLVILFGLSFYTKIMFFPTKIDCDENPTAEECKTSNSEAVSPCEKSTESQECIAFCKENEDDLQCLPQDKQESKPCDADENSAECKTYCKEHKTDEACSVNVNLVETECEGGDCYSDVQVNLDVQGSNTIGAELMPKLLNSYYSKEGNKAIDMAEIQLDDRKLIYENKREQKFAINLGSHGSNKGIEALISGTADIAMASRRIKPEEVAKLKELGKGDMENSSQEFVIGLDGIAIIVHPSNPLESITTEQLKDIFSGKITNWSQLGAGNQDINLYVRDDKSGTQDTFKNLVMDKEPVASAEDFEDSNALSSKVSGDVGGIGYIGLPYIKDAKALSVADGDNANPYRPTGFTIATEDYPLSRRLYLYVPKNATAARALAKFAISDEGQQIVRQAGFTHLTPDISAKSGPSDEDVISEEISKYEGNNTGYLALQEKGSRINTNFRFQFNSSKLDNKAKQDLTRITSLLSEKRNQGDDKRLILVGFADNKGSECINNGISRQRAQIVANELEAFGIKADVIEGMGSEAPVANNYNEQGREKNRRVELWVAPLKDLPRFPVKASCS